MNSLIQDLRYALRTMRRNPGAIVVAIVSLGLGIGATTAIYSVVYGALINPFPYKDVRNMFVPRLENATGKGGRGAFTMREFLAIQKLPAVADSLGVGWEDAVLGTDSAPETVRVVQMSGSAFSFLGVPPLLGRTVGPQDLGSTGQAARVIVLSYARWMKMYAADPRVVGQTIRLNNEPYTVIGVMPPRFTWFGRESIWAPLEVDPRSKQMIQIRLRLKAGVSRQDCTAQLQSLLTQLASESPKDYPKAGFRAILTPFLEQTVASWQLAKMLYILLGAVSFLLLIACANVANLLLARATARQKEIAVRASLGADRLRLVRQLLTESVLLATCGGALGVLLAYAALKSIVALIPDVFIPNEAVISVNGAVLLFSIAVSAATGILFGLAPAIQATRPDLNDALKDAAKGSSTSGSTGRTRNALVVAEVALSAMLLMGAGLTMRTFLALESVPLGYEPQGLLTVDFSAPQKRFTNPERLNVVFGQILERVRALPGVRSATAGNGGFPWAGPESAYSIPGKPEEPERRVRLAFVADGYLDVMRVRLLRGRTLTAEDAGRAERVAIINETAARQLWGTDDAVGKQITLELLKTPPPVLRLASGSPTVTIVGVIGDVRNNGLQEPPNPALMLPYSLVAPPWRTLALRTDGDPRLQVNAVRTAVASIEKELAVASTATGEDRMDSQTMGPRFTMVLFIVFAVVGLVLAALGIYSVLAYTVSRRINEIGIRMALGAQSREVIALIMASGLKLTLLGMQPG